MIRNCEPSGALQAGHLQCQPEAIAAWQKYVEHWLQLRVVKTTTIATGQEGVAHSVTLTSEASKTQRSNLLVFHFRTAVISRRAKKATALAEKKRLQELEKLAVKVSKASTENFKTRMSKTAKILARKRRPSSRKTTGLAKTKGPAFETAKTRQPDPQRNSFYAEQHPIFVLVSGQNKTGRPTPERERERKRAAYAKKKNALEELKQRHKAGPTWIWNR